MGGERGGGGGGRSKGNISTTLVWRGDTRRDETRRSNKHKRAKERGPAGHEAEKGGRLRLKTRRNAPFVRFFLEERLQLLDAVV